MDELTRRLDELGDAIAEVDSFLDGVGDKENGCFDFAPQRNQ